MKSPFRDGVPACQHQSLLDSNLEDGQYISAKDKDVIVIGGGDTGNGTSASFATWLQAWSISRSFPVVEHRADDNPWPQWPKIYRVDYGHEEGAGSSDKTRASLRSDAGVHRRRSRQPQASHDRCRLDQTRSPATRPVLGAGRNESDADLQYSWLSASSDPNRRSPNSWVWKPIRVRISGEFGDYATNVGGVFACGDLHRRGQSLVVWAIAEGR
ncbi:MAG: hypothetical protein R3B96_08165 [Pirellulaceae bacterium]